MTIRVWDYLQEYAEEREEILAAVDRVFSSGRLVLGDSVTSFESEFSAFHEQKHTVGVDNGTNAVALALQALGVGRGDEVITVSNTAAPTVVAIDAIGAVPVFVDIHEDTYLMDVAQLESVITDRTRCILPVHLYGQCVNMAEVNRIAEQHGIAVVEDCAQSHGARQNKRLAGTMSDAAAFSFYPTKVLGAYGDAGAVMTNTDAANTRLRRLRYYGMDTAYYVVETPGHNSRLDEVQAEILRLKLRRLDAYISRRRAIATKYNEALADTGLCLPAVAEGNEHSYYLYVVRHPARDEIIEKLKRFDISLNVSYPWPVHTMSGFQTQRAKLPLPRTEHAAKEIFSLPMYASLDEERRERVIDALRQVMPQP